MENNREKLKHFFFSLYGITIFFLFIFSIAAICIFSKEYFTTQKAIMMFLFIMLNIIFILVMKKISSSELNEVLDSIEKMKKGECGESGYSKTTGENKLIIKKLKELNENIISKENKILQQNKGLEYINEFLGCINRCTDLTEIVGYLGKYLNRLMNYKGGAVWVLNDEGEIVSDVYCLNGIGISPETGSEINTPIEKTSLQHVILKGSFLVRDIREEENKLYPEDSFLFEHGVKKILYIPLWYESKIIGVLTIGTEYEDDFTTEDVRSIEFLCKNISISIQNFKLMKSLNDSRKQISSIFKITRILASSLDVRDVFRELSSEIKNIVDFERMALVIPSEKEKFMLKILAVVTENSFKINSEQSFDRKNTSMDVVIETGQPFLRRDTKKEHFFLEDSLLLKKEVRSYITYPVRSKGKIVGTIDLGHRTANFYTSKDLEKLKPIAEQIGVAIENSMLFEEIKKSREEWEMTFDAVSDHVAIISLNSVIIKVNKSLADFFGKEPKEIIGKKCHEVFHQISNCHKSCPQSLMMESKKTETVEIYNEKLDKNFFISVSPIINAEGETTAILHITRDITEEKKLKNQLIQSEKMVSIGQLVSGVAHELNNPLAGIVGYSQLLLKSNLDNVVKKKIERILDQAQRSAKIVGNLLTFARKKKPERVFTDINNIITKTVELREYDFKANNIKVNLELMKSLPMTVVDPIQIQQVLINLMVNSEHSIAEAKRPSGNIIISTDVIQEAGKNKIRISVSDNGTGISGEIAGRMFDPFFTTKEVGKGTGLGLSISYGIISEHDGKIYTRNDKKEGATFVLELPILEGEAESSEETTPYEVIKNNSRKKVLVVDDEDDVRLCVKEYLSRKNYDVDEAHDGREAIKMLEENQYHLVISDMRMPGIGGEEFYSIVKEMFPPIAQRIIFMTGDSVNKKTLEFLKNNSNPFILKPFEFQQLDSELYKLSA